MIKSRRVALSWNPDFKDSVADIKYALRGTEEKDQSNGELFILCLGIGFKSKFKLSIPPRKSDAVRLSYLTERDISAMRAIAISETGRADVVTNEDEVFDIVEQFAAGGLALIAKRLADGDDIKKWLVAEIFTSFD